jgi:hypothetical protein
MVPAAGDAPGSAVCAFPAVAIRGPTVFKRLAQGLTVSLAVVLVASPVGASSVSPSTLPASPIAMGLSMIPFEQQSTFTYAVNKYGKAPATWAVWANWGDPAGTGAFPTALVDRLRNAGTVPFIYWQPVGTGRPPGHTSSPALQESCGVSYDKIIGGDWDNYIHSWAQSAIGHGTILIRFAHEMDGTWFPWSTSNCGNSYAKFITMWKHVVTIFRGDGASNVKFVWSPVNPHADRSSLYPGSTWVDYVGFTSYNWAAFKNKPWTSMLTNVSNATRGLSTYAGDKPWILAETGSVAGPGSRPQWLIDGYKALYRYVPNIKLVMYFDIDSRPIAHNQPDWRLNTTADIDAYKFLQTKPKFQGKVN